jgi:hypothetical protein
MEENATQNKATPENKYKKLKLRGGQAHDHKRS